MICGAPAETTSDGYWLETICDKCKDRMNKRREEDLKKWREENESNS